MGMKKPNIFEFFAVKKYFSAFYSICLENLRISLKTKFDIKKQSKALMATWMDVIKKSAEEEKRYVGTHSLPGHARGRVSLMIVHSNHSILRFILSIVLRNQTHPANLRPRLGARPSRRAGAGRELTRGAGAGRPS